MHLSPSSDLDGVTSGWTQHVSQLARYGGHRRRALALADYLRENADAVGWYPASEALHRAHKLTLCGEWLEYHDYPTVGETRLTSARFCQQTRLCGLCACRRGGKYLGAYSERVEAVRASQGHLRPFLATLTVKDGPDLAERIGHLLRSLAQLGKRRDNARRGRPTSSALAGVEGGVWSVEVKRGSRSGLWHPHVHGLLLADPSALAVEGTGNVGPLSGEWHRTTGDSFIVDVRPIGDSPEDFAEVFKYALKFGDLSFADNLEADYLLRGTRLVRSFGCLRGVEVPEQLTDDALGDHLPWVSYLYRHQFGAYTMVRSRIGGNWEHLTTGLSGVNNGSEDGKETSTSQRGPRP